MKVISTYFLIGINIIVFAWLAFQQQSLVMNTSADVLAILEAGANFNPYTLGGEPWRIITSMFLHFGIVHLLVNMYGLYVLGAVLEPALGTTRFLLLYFFCGIAAGIASLIFNLYVPSAGASGAIFGLFGYRLGAEFIGSFHDRQKLLNVLINFVIFVAINGYISTQVNVDMAGHIGGCFAGLLLAIFHFKLGWAKQKTYLAVLVVILASTLLVLPKDQLRYYQIFQGVLKTEDRTNELFETTETSGLKDSLLAILPAWDSIESSLDALRRVPSQLEADTAILRDYIQLTRRKTYYFVKQIERESFVYFDSVEILNEMLRSLPPMQYDLSHKLIGPQNEVVDTVTSSSSLFEPAKVFYDSHWKETEDTFSAKYYRVGKKDSLDRWQGAVLDYYKDGNIQMKGKYVDDMKDGVFIYYSDHNTYESAGRYEKEMAVGKWETFHWNGNLRSEVFYGDQTFTGNVFDSLGNPQVVNGNGKSIHWYASGQVAEEGDYRNGRKEGFWYGFHPDGKPYYKEQYRDNRLVHGVSEGKDGGRYVYDHLSEFPLPVNGMPAFHTYVEKNIRRSFSKPVTGKVNVIFTVGIDGSRWSYVIIKSISKESDREAIRLIKEGPAWRPALLHGQEKVPSQGYVEINF